MIETPSQYYEAFLFENCSTIEQFIEDFDDDSENSVAEFDSALNAFTAKLFDTWKVQKAFSMLLELFEEIDQQVA